jgi:hypothetical protein
MDGSMVIPRSWKDADARAAVRDFLEQRPPRRAAIRELMKALLTLMKAELRTAAGHAR